MLNVPYGIVGYSGRMGHEIVQAAGGIPCVRVWDKGDECDAAPRVIFDFSLPSAFNRVIELCREYHCALVSGTTALSAEQEKQLRELAKEVPVVRSANYSIGITIMAMILREFGPLMKDWDAEIAEAHHNRKKDAPSGTALMLGRALGRDVNMNSFRLGGLPGDHSAYFANDGELLSISHRAISRSVFAIGAVKAAEFALNHPAGFYSFEDVVRSGSGK